VAEIDVYKEWLGIPEGDRPPDLYTLLRLVQFEDDSEKIRDNYRKLNTEVRKYATGQYLQQSQDLLNEMAKAMLCLTDPDAKREYDESQGREFEPEQTDGAETTLQYLVSHSVIKRGQVSEIEHFADARGISHRDAVVQMKLVKPVQAARALATELRMSFVDLEDMLPEDETLDQLPRQVAKRHSCLPLFEDRGKLMVACVDEPSPELEDEIRMRYGMPMRGVLAVPRSIQQAIAKYYAKGMRDEAVAEAAPATSGKAAKTGAAKPKKVTAQAGPLSDEDMAQRKQISYLIICWSVIGTVVPINQLGLMGTGLIGTICMLATGAAVGGAVTWILKQSYWKS